MNIRGCQTVFALFVIACGAPDVTDDADDAEVEIIEDVAKEDALPRPYGSLALDGATIGQFARLELRRDKTFDLKWHDPDFQPQDWSRASGTFKFTTTNKNHHRKRFIRLIDDDGTVDRVEYTLNGDVVSLKRDGLAWFQMTRPQEGSCAAAPALGATCACSSGYRVSDHSITCACCATPTAPIPPASCAGTCAPGSFCHYVVHATPSGGWQADPGTCQPLGACGPNLCQCPIPTPCAHECKLEGGVYTFAEICN